MTIEERMESLERKIDMICQVLTGELQPREIRTMEIKELVGALKRGDRGPLKQWNRRHSKQ